MKSIPLVSTLLFQLTKTGLKNIHKSRLKFTLSWKVTSFIRCENQKVGNRLTSAGRFSFSAMISEKVFIVSLDAMLFGFEFRTLFLSRNLIGLKTAVATGTPIN